MWMTDKMDTNDDQARELEAEKVIEKSKQDLPSVWLGGRQKWVLVKGIADVLRERDKELDKAKQLNRAFSDACAMLIEPLSEAGYDHVNMTQPVHYVNLISELLQNVHTPYHDMMARQGVWESVNAHVRLKGVTNSDEQQEFLAWCYYQREKERADGENN